MSSFYFTVVQLRATFCSSITSASVHFRDSTSNAWWRHLCLYLAATATFCMLENNNVEHARMVYVFMLLFFVFLPIIHDVR